MRDHSYVFNRDSVFTLSNDFTLKVDKLKSILKRKGVSIPAGLKITADNIDSLLNNVHVIVKQSKAINGKQGILENGIIVEKAEPVREQENIKTDIGVDIVPQAEVTINTPVDKDFLIESHLERIRQAVKDTKVGKEARSDIKDGFIYLIENKHFPGWVKCGMTMDYVDRLATYNVCDPTNSFKYIDIRYTQNRRLSENLLIEKLSNTNPERNGEWFKIEKEYVINIFNNIN